MRGPAAEPHTQLTSMDSHPQAWLPLDHSTQVRTVPRAEPDSFPEVPQPSAAPRPGLSQHGTLHRPPGHSGIVGLSPRGQLTGVTWGAAAPRYGGRERGCEARSPAQGTSGGPRCWRRRPGPPGPRPDVASVQGPCWSSAPCPAPNGGVTSTTPNGEVTVTVTLGPGLRGERPPRWSPVWGQRCQPSRDPVWPHVRPTATGAGRGRRGSVGTAEG